MTVSQQQVNVMAEGREPRPSTDEGKLMYNVFLGGIVLTESLISLLAPVDRSGDGFKGSCSTDSCFFASSEWVLSGDFLGCDEAEWWEMIEMS